jgi:hypothetical protein
VHGFVSRARARPRPLLPLGEDTARAAMRRMLADRHQLNAECPRLNEVIEI